LSRFGLRRPDGGARRNHGVSTAEPDQQMRVAVIGAGINGVMSSWALADAGHEVLLIERGRAMDATSSASSKMLHGGLRYLEHGEVGLVREGLRERAWWIEAAPHLAHRFELVLPVYSGAPRSRWMLKLGLLAYDILAGGRGLGRHRWLGVEQLCAQAPGLRRERLTGGYVYSDGQMDDRALGLWALARARAAGVNLREGAEVERVDTGGGVTVGGVRESYDRVVNAAGPWAGELLARSGVESSHRLDLVRGSHLVLPQPLASGFLLQSPDDGRVCFALPYRGQALVGTTEVRQSLDEPIACSAEERDYLLNVWNACFEPRLRHADIVGAFSGLRPLVGGAAGDARQVSRDYEIERRGCLVSVFGGKWTTARALGRRVARAAAA
jgi:glycerol-3-phosphate dehydrogenase